MFIATVEQQPVPDSEKMSHLKIPLMGKVKPAISEMDYRGQFYAADGTLRRVNLVGLK